MINRAISTRNLEADDTGIRFDVDIDGRMLRAHISYRRLIGRMPTRAEKALPPKYLFEGRRSLVQALVDDATVGRRAGDIDYVID